MSKSKLGITEGEWIRLGLSIYAKDSNVNIACLDPSMYSISQEERKANQKLIADAGTTANKCGLLPSELLKQRNELLEALKYCNSVGHKQSISFETKTAEIQHLKEVIHNVFLVSKKLIQSIEKE